MEINGKFKVQCNTPFGQQKGILDLMVTGNVLTGNLDFLGEIIELKNGRMTNNSFVFSGDINTPLGSFKADIEGRVDGDTLKAKLKLPIRTFGVTGIRIKT